MILNSQGIKSRNDATIRDIGTFIVKIVAGGFKNPLSKVDYNIPPTVSSAIFCSSISEDKPLCFYRKAFYYLLVLILLITARGDESKGKTKRF